MEIHVGFIVILQGLETYYVSGTDHALKFELGWNKHMFSCLNRNPGKIKSDDLKVEIVIRI